MATKTTNYKFAKPEITDFYDINVYNDTLDDIDKEIKTLDTRTTYKIVTETIVYTESGTYMLPSDIYQNKVSIKAFGGGGGQTSYWGNSTRYYSGGGGGGYMSQATWDVSGHGQKTIEISIGASGGYAAGYNSDTQSSTDSNNGGPTTVVCGSNSITASGGEKGSLSTGSGMSNGGNGGTGGGGGGTIGSDQYDKYAGKGGNGAYGGGGGSSSYTKTYGGDGGTYGGGGGGYTFGGEPGKNNLGYGGDSSNVAENGVDTTSDTTIPEAFRGEGKGGAEGTSSVENQSAGHGGGGGYGGNGGDGGDLKAERIGGGCGGGGGYGGNGGKGAGTALTSSSSQGIAGGGGGGGYGGDGGNATDYYGGGGGGYGPNNYGCGAGGSNLKAMPGCVVLTYNRKVFTEE